MPAQGRKSRLPSPFELGQKAGADAECPFAPGSVERHNFEIGRRYAAEVKTRPLLRA